jgi:hypothetical protein
MQRCAALSGIEPSIRVHLPQTSLVGLQPTGRLSVPDRLERKQRLHDLSP